MLNSSKITALIVVEAGKPVGIVHFHDLLRAGRGLTRKRWSSNVHLIPKDAAHVDPASRRLHDQSRRPRRARSALGCRPGSPGPVTRQTVSSIRTRPTPSTIGLSSVNTRPT